MGHWMLEVWRVKKGRRRRDWSFLDVLLHSGPASVPQPSAAPQSDYCRREDISCLSSWDAAILNDSRAQCPSEEQKDLCAIELLPVSRGADALQGFSLFQEMVLSLFDSNGCDTPWHSSASLSGCTSQSIITVSRYRWRSAFEWTRIYAETFEAERWKIFLGLSSSLTIYVTGSPNAKSLNTTHF